MSQYQYILNRSYWNIFFKYHPYVNRMPPSSNCKLTLSIVSPIQRWNVRVHRFLTTYPLCSV